MDRLEIQYILIMQNKDIHLHSSMDRLEIQYLDDDKSKKDIFTFQYG